MPARLIGRLIGVSSASSALLLTLIAACSGGGDGTTTPSTTSGSSGDTSSSSSSGASSSSSGGSSSSSSGASSGTSSGTAQNGPAIYCDNDGSTCVCMKDQAQIPKGDATKQCSKGSVTGATPRCCSNPEWPASGACLCTSAAANCHQSADKQTCQCGLAQPGAGDTPVGSCSGKICCQDPSNAAPSCACYTKLDTCMFGTPVPSCGVESLKCEGKEVTDCRQ